jgi:MFS family permease
MLLRLFMSTRQQLEIRRERGVSEMFRALRHRNFRLFWSGALLSNVGTWMQAVAQGWLVLSLSNSPLWLGIDGFMATAPGLVFTLAGGVFADLVDRRKLLIYTQAVAGLSALTLGVLVLTHVVQVWMILCLSFVTGCCMSLAGPSYMALVFDLVGHRDLANAIALNSTQFQLARAIGPVFAGLGFKLFGLAGCFIANGISFVFVVVAMLLVKFNKPGGGPATRFDVVDNLCGGELVWRSLHLHDSRIRPRYFSPGRDGSGSLAGNGRGRGPVWRAVSRLSGRLQTQGLVRYLWCPDLCNLPDLFFLIDEHSLVAGLFIRPGFRDYVFSCSHQHAASETGHR